MAHSTRIALYILILTVISVIPCCQPARGSDNTLSLEELIAVDAAIVDGITVRGTQSQRIGGFQPRDYELTYSSSGDRHVAKLASVAGAAFVPGRSAAVYSSPSGKKLGNVVASEIVSFDPELSGKRTVLDVYQVDADDAVVLIGQAASTTLSPPTSAHWTLHSKRVMWTLGRGFSPYITKLISVDYVDQNLKVEAIGFDSEAFEGRWSLTIDPNNGLLVRQAEFSGNGGERVYSVENRGEIEVSGLVFAAEGRFTTHSVQQTDSLAFASVELTPTDALLSEGRRALDDRATPGLLVTDLRSKTPIITETKDDGTVRTFNTPRQRHQVTSGAARGGRWLHALIAFNALMIAAFFALIVYRRRCRPDLGNR